MSDKGDDKVEKRDRGDNDLEKRGAPKIPPPVKKDGNKGVPKVPPPKPPKKDKT